jgi:hypothetical protein
MSARSTPAVQNIFDASTSCADGAWIGGGAPQFGLRRAFYVTVGKAF